MENEKRTVEDVRKDFEILQELTKRYDKQSKLFGFLSLKDGKITIDPLKPLLTQPPSGRSFEL